MITQQRETIIQASPVQNRRHDFDWLRVGVVFLLFPYHTARVFDTFEPFYVKNGQTADPFSWFIIAASPWSMALLFFLAGAVSWYALGFRSGGRYFQERVQRLLLPFFFALVLVIPPQAYFAQLIRHTFSGNFFEFYPVYFQNINFAVSDYEGTVFTMAHLWFVLFLLVFSLVALPLFLYIKGEKSRDFISRWAGRLAAPAIFVIVPALLVVASIVPDFLGKTAAEFLVLFVVGFIFQADERFTNVIYRFGYIILGLGLVSFLVGGMLIQYKDEPGFPPGKIGFGLAYNLAVWFLVCAMLALGHRYLNFSNGLLKYLNKASYPVYILHQTIIVMVAYYVVQWDWNIFIKYLTILGVSLAITLGLYELLICRINLLKALFGLKAGKRSP